MKLTLLAVQARPLDSLLVGIKGMQGMGQE